LVPAGVFPRRTGEADMEMIIVSEVRAYLVEPRPVALCVAAERFLDRRVDENPLHRGIKCCGPDYCEVIRRPFGRINVKAIGPHHAHCRHFLALQPGQLAIWHGRKPNIGIETDLM
jgi:hypothetical protein